MSTGAQNRYRDLVEPVVVAQGYDLEEVSVSSAGRRSVVRIVIDRDGGVDLDLVAEVSRAVSVVLDQADELGSAPYVLEVTSPGVDRPLTEPRHWRRNVGRLVTAGDLSGRIVDTDDSGVLIEVDGAREFIAFTDLAPGQVVVEFRRPEDGS